MFDLFFLDYIVTVSFGFRIIHLELTSKSGDQIMLKGLY